jgi:hypothetical protein
LPPPQQPVFYVPTQQQQYIQNNYKPNKRRGSSRSLTQKSK